LLIKGDQASAAGSDENAVIVDKRILTGSYRVVALFLWFSARRFPGFASSAWNGIGIGKDSYSQPPHCA
jgi:hypothetical protein